MKIKMMAVLGVLFVLGVGTSAWAGGPSLILRMATTGTEYHGTLRFYGVQLVVSGTTSEVLHAMALAKSYIAEHEGSEFKHEMPTWLSIIEINPSLGPWKDVHIATIHFARARRYSAEVMPGYQAARLMLETLSSNMAGATVRDELSMERVAHRHQ